MKHINVKFNPIYAVLLLIALAMVYVLPYHVNSFTQKNVAQCTSDMNGMFSIPVESKIINLTSYIEKHKSILLKSNDVNLNNLKVLWVKKETAVQQLIHTACTGDYSKAIGKSIQTYQALEIFFDNQLEALRKVVENNQNTA